MTRSCLTLAILASLCLLLASCGYDPCAGLTEPSILCPNGPTYATPPDASAADIPCGETVCDDGAGGMLQDVGEHCAGDDNDPPSPGNYACCHGLVCVGKVPGMFTGGGMGTCQRAAVTAGPEVCPKNLWLYSCVGTYGATLAGHMTMTSIDRIGYFTGPPPSEVQATQPGGLGAWMKTKFFTWNNRALTTLVVGGVTYKLLFAKDCMPVGPYVPVP